MRIKLIIIIFFLPFSLKTFAQASGGQIRRSSPKPKTEVRKPSKPRHTTSLSEQSIPTDTPPTIQPISINNLATYNVVVGTFSILANAQGLCKTLRNEGWGAQIYLDLSNMYCVLMVGSDQEPEVVLYRNHARQKYPNAWILKIENGHEYKYE